MIGCAVLSPLLAPPVVVEKAEHVAFTKVRVAQKYPKHMPDHTQTKQFQFLLLYSSQLRSSLSASGLLLVWPHFVCILQAEVTPTALQWHLRCRRSASSLRRPSKDSNAEGSWDTSSVLLTIHAICRVEDAWVFKAHAPPWEHATTLSSALTLLGNLQDKEIFIDVVVDW